jgi:hypothetical protein
LRITQAATEFSLSLHPLRDGRSFGAVGGPIVHCGTAMPAGGRAADQVIVTPAIS